MRICRPEGMMLSAPSSFWSMFYACFSSCRMISDHKYFNAMNAAIACYSYMQLYAAIRNPSFGNPLRWERNPGSTQSSRTGKHLKLSEDGKGTWSAAGVMSSSSLQFGWPVKPYHSYHQPRLWAESEWDVNCHTRRLPSRMKIEANVCFVNPRAPARCATMPQGGKVNRNNRSTVAWRSLLTRWAPFRQL